MQSVNQKPTRLYPGVSCVVAAINPDGSETADHFYIEGGLESDYLDGCSAGTRAAIEVLFDTARDGADAIGLLDPIIKRAAKHLDSDSVGMRGAAIGFLSTIDAFVIWALERIPLADLAQFAKEEVGSDIRLRRQMFKDFQKEATDFLETVCG
jgi:hypothetical protein